MARAKAKKENAIVRYIRETRSELRKVNWPSREETIRLTQIVLAVTFAMGVFLWLMDVLFSWWLEGVLISDPWRIALVIVILVAGSVVAVVLARRRG
jgi:preprotein translocase subunit SecE